MLRPKVLLLDVDGVVLRQNKIMHHVSNKIVHYVSKELHMPVNDALKVNKLLYTEYGHSYRGLRKVYGFDKSIHHFNSTIYTQEALDMVHNSNNDINQHIHYMMLRQMMLRCQHKGVPVYLFTNAPTVWCKAVLGASGLDKYIGDENIISCDHDVMLFHEDDGFKPVDVVYNTVKTFVSNTHHMDEPTYIFIEDSFKNLVPIVGDNSWIPVFLSPNTKLNVAHSQVLPSNVMVISNIREAKNLLTY